MKKSEKTEITVSRIIEAAMDEFGKNGYAGGTVNNICKAGINKGLLYHNFAGKDDLYLTCLNQSCGKLMQYIQEREGTKDPERYMAVRMEFFNACPREAHIFFEALLNPPAHLSGEVRQALAAFNELNETRLILGIHHVFRLRFDDIDLGGRQILSRRELIVVHSFSS